MITCRSGFGCLNKYLDNLGSVDACTVYVLILTTTFYVHHTYIIHGNLKHMKEAQILMVCFRFLFQLISLLFFIDVDHHNVR